MHEDSQLLGEFEPAIRPNIPYVVLVALVIGGFLGSVMGAFIGFGGTVAITLLVDQGIGSAMWITGAMILGAATLPLTMVVVGWVYYKSLFHVSYRVYDDRIEKESGVFTQSETVVRFQDITDVSYKQPFFYSFFDVGSVGISTAGEDGESFSISSVENAEALYREMQALTQEEELPRFSVLNQPV